MNSATKNLGTRSRRWGVILLLATFVAACGEKAEPGSASLEESGDASALVAPDSSQNIAAGRWRPLRQAPTLTDEQLEAIEQ